MTKAHRITATELDPDFVAGLKIFWEDGIPFNRVLGLKIESVSPQRVQVRMSMRPDLEGHRPSHRIHGGAISAALDVVGSLALMASIAARHTDEPAAQIMERFSKISTIDLHVDYLRPGVGELFTVCAQTLRLGSRVGTARVEFFSSDGKLLSCGSAAYMVS
jgi:uncharacterized protein (TIGR00369 family)